MEQVAPPAYMWCPIILTLYMCLTGNAWPLGEFDEVDLQPNLEVLDPQDFDRPRYLPSNMDMSVFQLPMSDPGAELPEGKGGEVPAICLGSF